MHYEHPMSKLGNILLKKPVALQERKRFDIILLARGFLFCPEMRETVKKPVEHPLASVRLQ